MVRIKIIVEGEHEASYERDPYILTVSRVPCIAEHIHAAGSAEGPLKREPACYEVIGVTHEAGFGDTLAARVRVTELRVV